MWMRSSASKSRLLNRAAVAAIVAGMVGVGGAASAQTLDIIHWWTSGGEFEGLKLLREDLEQQGVEWVDAASAGGAGSSARTVFRTRMQANDPPAVMQALGTEVNEWADQGVLTDLSDLAAEEGWLEVIPQPLQEFVVVDGQVVSVPAVWSQINWVFGNKALFEEHGQEIPQSWDDLVAVAEAFRDAGVIPIAHGGQPWQTAAVFDGILVSMDDPDFYRRVAVEQDEDAMRSDQMVEALSRLRWFSTMVDEGSPGREWNRATAMVGNGEAAMQFMGDWAKSELVNSGGVVDDTFVCFPTPGSNDMFVFLADFFFFVEVEDPAKQQAQRMFASAMLEPEFQEEFNLLKGGLPVRTDVSTERFDACTVDSIDRVVRADSRGGLVPSLGFAHAVRSDVQGVFHDTLSEYFNTADMTPEEAIDILLDELDLL